MIGMKLKDSIKLGVATLDKSYPQVNVQLEDGSNKYLYQPGEQHGDKKRRATDFIWSKITDRSDQIVALLGNHVFYCFQNGHGRVFVREELEHIPEDTQVLPDRLSKWK